MFIKFISIRFHNRLSRIEFVSRWLIEVWYVRVWANNDQRQRGLLVSCSFLSFYILMRDIIVSTFLQSFDTIFMQYNADIVQKSWCDK